MGRSTIKMELIEKESTRIQTFQKRRKNLVKKISELSILCEIDALMVIYGPEFKDKPLKLDTVWPQDSDKVKSILDKYAKSDKTKRDYSVSDYFSEKNKKLEAEILKLRKEVCAARYPTWDPRLDSYSRDDLKALEAQLEDQIAAADKRLKMKKQIQIQNQNQIQIQNSSLMPENALYRSSACFQPGESSFGNWENLNYGYGDSSGNYLQQQHYSGLNPMMMIPMSSSLFERNQPFEEENMRNIWQQNQSFHVNNNWENSAGMLTNSNNFRSNWENMLLLPPNVQFPSSSFPNYQVKPPQ